MPRVLDFADGFTSNDPPTAEGVGYEKGATQTISAGGTIAVGTTGKLQIIPVQSDGGAITLSTTPFGSSSWIDGTSVLIFGLSDTDTVTIPHNDAAEGAVLREQNVEILAKHVSIHFIFCETEDRWIEIESRTSEDQVALNVTNIGTNTTNIGTNTTDIGTNATDIGTNTTDIGTNTTNIGTNTTDIGTNTTDIGTNTTNIGTNATDITTLETLSVTATEGVQRTSGTNLTAAAEFKADVSGLTADATPDSAADFVMTYDVSAGTHKKVLLDNLPAGGGGGVVATKDNILINSDFGIWQRGTSLSSDNTFSADRIKFRSLSANATITRQTSTVAGKKYSLKLTSNVSQTFAQIGSQIEFADFGHLAGQTVTFKYKAKAINVNTGSTNQNVSFYSNTTEDTPIAWGGGGGTSLITFSAKVLTTSLTENSVTFTIPSTAKSLWWQIGNESTPGIGDGFFVENVMIHEGSVDQPFVRAGKSIQDEISMCERYFLKSYNLTTNPGSVTGTGSRQFQKRASSGLEPFQLSTRMRVTATVTWYSKGTGASGLIRNDTTASDVSASNSLPGESSINLIPGGTDGQQLAAHYTCDAELG